MDAPTLNSTTSIAQTTAEIPFKVYKSYSERQLLAAICITSSIVGIIGNSLTVIAVSLSKKLQTVTNVFVVNLSICDLVSCLVLPWEAVAVLGGVDGEWALPNAYWLCVATSAILIAGSACSITNLCMIAVNRWVGITKASATVGRLYTPKKIACMVAFSWCYAFIMVVAPLATDFGELGYEPLYSTCSWVKANPYSNLYSLVVALAYFPVQLVVVVLCYASILHYVTKLSQRMSRQDASSISGNVAGADRSMRKRMWKRQLAVTKNLVYILLAYIICITPVFVSFLPLGYDWSIRMTPYAGAVLYFNSCVNPIIYASSHPDFKEVFGCMVRCKWAEILRNRPPPGCTGTQTRSFASVSNIRT